MEFEDPDYSDEVIVEFEKFCADLEEQREKMEQYLTLVFEKRWSKYCH